MLAKVGLTDVAGKKAGTFSLGMSQRLGIATALLGDPQVLIFDEPINGLDPEGIWWARTLMQRLAQEGRTVFVSSHLLAEMANTADRLVVIGQGRLIAATTSTELVSSAGGDVVCVRSPRSETLHEVLTTAGLHVQFDGGALLVSGCSTAQVGELAAEMVSRCTSCACNARR